MKMAKTNVYLVNLIKDLEQISNKEKVNLWKRIANDLNKPTRRRRVVNLSKIERYAKDNETIVVPGKVLASGDLNRKLTIAAYQFSEQAREKINRNGTALTIRELLAKNPKGRKTRILG